MPHPAVTRVLYTPADLAARRSLIQLADASGLTWCQDAIGNWFVRLEGMDPELPALASGSHTDAMPHAGRYDGVVGVLGGLEVLRPVKEADVTRKLSLELVMFAYEEPTRCGVGCLGSRAMTAMIPWAKLGKLTDGDGTSLDEARDQAGLASGRRWRLPDSPVSTGPCPVGPAIRRMPQGLPRPGVWRTGWCVGRPATGSPRTGTGRQNRPQPHPRANWRSRCA